MDYRDSRAETPLATSRAIGGRLPGSPLCPTRARPPLAWKRLTGEMKAFVVRRLACLESPSAVVDAVREEFGEIISRQTVQRYDPYALAGAGLSPRWRQLFEDTRRAFLDKTMNIGISHRAVRLSRLEAAYELAAERGDSRAILKLLEQAAKEMGGVYVSRGAGGLGRETVPTEPRRPREATFARARASSPSDRKPALRSSD